MDIAECEKLISNGCICNYAYLHTKMNTKHPGKFLSKQYKITMPGNSFFGALPEQRFVKLACVSWHTSR